MNKCFITKNNDQWSTPKNIYDFFISSGFVDFNPLSLNYEDSLRKQFSCNLFCNPPYSNIEPFVDYMIEHCKNGYTIVMLLPTRSGTKWFKKLFEFYHCHFYFFTQRLHFNDFKSAPFDTFLVYLNLAYNNEFKFIDRNLNVV